MTTLAMPKPPDTAAGRSKRPRTRATAESMAKAQREISVSEFFAKNRHLLGFDNARKAMLTTVKEAVDNALDACEEAGILPEVSIRVLALSETRFRITVRDNGPGIVKKQIEHIFGRLLYGSKFHRMKMSRGQQGIGISAAGMYGLMTTGKPVLIISKTGKKQPAHEMSLKMDTSRNCAEVITDEEHQEDDLLFPEGHGTQVEIELEGRYLKGRQSIDEYLEQTAIANPHAKIVWQGPGAETIVFPRAVEELPDEPREIKPHPNGIELGTLIQMIERTEAKQLGAFLQGDFCRVGQAKAVEICERARLTTRTWLKAIGHNEAEALYGAIQEVRIAAPPTDCLVPIGSRALLAGLLKEVQAEFFAASTRPPAVYRGNPFQIEVAIAYGGSLPGDEPCRVLRFANRVPLLYQQAACCSFKAALDAGWKNYGLSQPKGSLPVGPLVVLVHMASVWVPFTSESKEAIADYDEIRKEIKLALRECGRKLGTYLRRRRRMQREADRRSVFERYIGEIAKNCEAVTGTDATRIYEALLRQAQRRTEEADYQLDDEGRVVDDGGALAKDESVVIIEDRSARSDEGVERVEGAVDSGGAEETLFDVGGGDGVAPVRRTKKKAAKRSKKRGRAGSGS